MNRQFKALYSLTIASIKMYFRNVSAVFFTLFIPVLLVVIFGLLNSNNNGPSVNIGLTKNSNTELANRLVKAIKDVKAFKVEEGSEQQLRDKLGKGKIDLQIVVPT